MWELLIILVIILLLFGARRLPEMAKGIGQAIREFRTGIKDVQDDIEGKNTAADPNRPGGTAPVDNKDQA